MRKSYFQVQNRIISSMSNNNLTGEFNVDTFHFIFEEDEWKDLDKTLVLSVNETVYNVPLLNDEALLPREVYEPGTIIIGIFGSKIINEVPEKVLSTKPFGIEILKGSYKLGKNPVNIMTPTQWDLYVAEINRLLEQCNATKEQCEQIHRTVNELAENAASSARSAGASAESAASSASAASTSATNAATSASNAAESASSASGSASSASSSARNAATSESNAKTSEDNASESEANASTSASNAQSSATAASTSANNASSSATSASESASAAERSKNEAQRIVNEFTPQIPTKTSDITNDGSDGTNPFITNQVNNLINYELKTNTGTSLEVTINNTTFVMTMKLKNSAGTVLSTQSIDLPLETMVVNASYANGTLTLELQNGTTINVPISSLISGLVSEERKIVGIDLRDDITKSELLNALNVSDGAQVNVIETVKVDGTIISISNKTINIDLSAKENITNKVTDIDANSTDIQYPSAKCVYGKMKAINEKTQNIDARVRILENKGGRAYSIIRKKNDNSSSAWIRADDAVGLVANARIETTEAVQNDFDNIYPWSDIKDCNVDANGEPTYFLGESGFTREQEVYVRIPKHWIKREQFDIEEDGVINTYEKITIYDYNAEGSQEIAEYKVGKYHTAEENGVHVSKTGLVPKSEYTKANFRTKARAKGTNWSLLDWHWFDLCYLYLVEFADYNSEEKLGHGYIYSNDTKSLLAESSTNRVVINNMAGMYVGKTISIGTAKGNYSIARSRQVVAINDYSDETLSNKMEIVFDGDPVNVTTASTVWQSPQINGDLDSFGNTSGCLVSDMYHSVIYRGIENIFGELWQHVDGISIKDGLTYVCYDPTQYANDKFTEPYVALGYENAKTNDSYIREVGYDEDHQLIGMPTRVGGSSSTYLCDTYWYGTGNRILYVGGSSPASGSKYGLFASACSNASSSSSWNNRLSPSYSTSINGGLGVVNPQKIYLTCRIVIFISSLRYNFKKRDLMCAAPCFVLFGFACTSAVIRTLTVASMVFSLRIVTMLLRTRTGTTGARQLIEVIILHIIFLATWQKLSRNWVSLVNN